MNNQIVRLLLVCVVFAPACNKAGRGEPDSAGDRRGQGDAPNDATRAVDHLRQPDGVLEDSPSFDLPKQEDLRGCFDQEQKSVETSTDFLTSDETPDGCGPGLCGDECVSCQPGMDCIDGKCKAPCFPVCEGKQCGNDHCGGTCGACPPGHVCSKAMEYQCVPKDECVSKCVGNECGDDGCGGSCGSCPGEWYCQSGWCIPQCQPQCLLPEDYVAYKQCGWDECPGQQLCGVCPEGFECAPGYVCVETKCLCGGKQCGSPSAGCSNSCGKCQPGFACDMETLVDAETNVCEPCTPDCTGKNGAPKECGSDGCDGLCGNLCAAGFLCDEEPADGDDYLFQCEPCTPDCTNDDGTPRECGSDACSGTCGQCPATDTCNEATGTCEACEPVCTYPPDDVYPNMECGPNSCPPGCMDKGIKPCEDEHDCDPGTLCNAITGMCVACGSCGYCPPWISCNVSKEKEKLGYALYTCLICQAMCAGKECGFDGCGGLCGICPGGTKCNPEGVCK